MSDTEVKDKKPTVDIEALTKSIDDKIKSGLDGFSSKLDEKLAGQKKEQKDVLDDFKWPHEDDEDTEDKPITKGELKDVVKGVLAESDKRTEKFLTKHSTEQSARTQRDQQALTAFPMLNNQSPYYDKDFEDAVQKEMNERVKRGRKGDDIDLLFDSAAAIKATSAKWAKPISEKVNDENRQFNNQQAQFGVRGKVGNQSKKPNEEQIELARKMGLSKEKLEKYWKP